MATFGVTVQLATGFLFFSNLQLPSKSELYASACTAGTDLLPGESSKQGEATLISPLLQLWAIQVVLVRAAATKVQHTLPKLQA
jgi:uncharacterized membrane protein YeiH